MSTGRQRISARDYKHAGPSRPLFDFEQYKQFGAGLAVGLVIALFVWIHDHRAGPLAEEELAAEVAPEAVEAPVPASAAAESQDSPAEYAFYDMLPNFEFDVPVPDRSAAKRRDQPAAPVALPGAYVLQVGAYRNVAGAELQRDKLAKLEIEASILHVSDDSDQWHIVRVGPLRDLDRINAMQKTLHAAGIDVLVQRAGD